MQDLKKRHSILVHFFLHFHTLLQVQYILHQNNQNKIAFSPNFQIKFEQGCQNVCFCTTKNWNLQTLGEESHGFMADTLPGAVKVLLSYSSHKALTNVGIVTLTLLV